MRLMTFRFTLARITLAVSLVPGGVAPILEINAKHDLRLPNSLLDIIREDIREIPTSKVSPISLAED